MDIQTQQRASGVLFPYNQPNMAPRVMRRLRAMRTLAPHAILGAALGILIIHPLAMAAAWFELSATWSKTGETLWSFLHDHIWSLFLPHQLPMSAFYAAIGGVIGIGFGLYNLVLHGRVRTVHYYEDELVRSMPFLIASGESERMEFKASVRWDFEHVRVNKALEDAVGKSIAGFFNHRGGNLLIGVTDLGRITGVESDYRTLKHQNRDGFQRCIADIVKTRLGGDLCPLIHILFHRLEDKDVCLVAVEPAPRPVYFTDGKSPRFFVRTGNSTRELDVREAMDHAANRWSG